MTTSILPPNFNFYICGVDEVPKYEDKFITDIIAFTHPGNQNEANYDDFNFSPKINKFCVHDVFDDRYHSDGLKWPDEKLIKDIISVCDDIKKKVDEHEMVNCLIHCQAGISRSTAAAFILLSILTGEWKERDCINEIYQRRWIMRPNPLMIEFADKLLNRGGKMLSLVDTREKKDVDDVLLF
jgi:predicted protein tyrosine phosphatase